MHCNLGDKLVDLAMHDPTATNSKFFMILGKIELNE
jgi:hypothetical protein